MIPMWTVWALEPKACTCYSISRCTWILNQYILQYWFESIHPIPIGKICFHHQLNQAYCYVDNNQRSKETIHHQSLHCRVYVKLLATYPYTPNLLEGGRGGGCESNAVDDESKLMLSLWVIGNELCNCSQDIVRFDVKRIKLDHYFGW